MNEYALDAPWSLLSSQVAKARAALFTVFLFIPSNLLRSLATKTARVGEADESEHHLSLMPIFHLDRETCDHFYTSYTPLQVMMKGRAQKRLQVVMAKARKTLCGLGGHLASGYCTRFAGPVQLPSDF